jgi:hypothetical protein
MGRTPFKRSKLSNIEIDAKRRLAQQAITTAHHPERQRRSKM